MATNPSKSVRILGVDPGLRLTGYGVIDHRPARPAVLLDAGVLRLDAKAPIPARLHELDRELNAIVDEHRPDAMAVELLYSNYKHPRTAILMAHARGVILLCAQRHGLALHQVAANRVKQSLTGHGHTSKEGMQAAIQHYFKLAELPSPPDVADALAIALAAGQNLDRPAKLR